MPSAAAIPARGELPLDALRRNPGRSRARPRRTERSARSIEAAGAQRIARAVAARAPASIRRTGSRPPRPRAGRCGSGSRCLRLRSRLRRCAISTSDGEVWILRTVADFAGRTAATSISRCAAKQSRATGNAPARAPCLRHRRGQRSRARIRTRAGEATGGSSGSPYLSAGSPRACPARRSMQSVAARPSTPATWRRDDFVESTLERYAREGRRARPPDQQRRRRGGRARRGHLGRGLALGRGHQPARRSARLPRCRSADAQAGIRAPSSTSRARGVRGRAADGRLQREQGGRDCTHGDARGGAQRIGCAGHRSRCPVSSAPDCSDDAGAGRESAMARRLMARSTYDAADAARAILAATARGRLYIVWPKEYVWLWRIKRFFPMSFSGTCSVCGHDRLRARGIHGEDEPCVDLGQPLEHGRDRRAHCRRSLVSTLAESEPRSRHWQPGRSSGARARRRRRRGPSRRADGIRSAACSRPARDVRRRRRRPARTRSGMSRTLVSVGHRRGIRSRPDRCPE